MKHFDVIHESVLDVTQRDFRRRQSTEWRNWIWSGIHTQWTYGMNFSRKIQHDVKHFAHGWWKDMPNTKMLFPSCRRIMKSKPTERFEEFGGLKMALQLIVGLLFVTGYRSFSGTESLPLDIQENGLPGLLILPLATSFVGLSQIIITLSCVSNTSTEFGRPPQQNHCGSAFIAARDGSPSRDGYGISCSFMHWAKWRTHWGTINV